MIVVREAKDGTLERIAGNPVLLSLDGKEKAPLLTIMHESWNAADRARFGIFIAENFAMPDGMQADSPERFERGDDGVMRQVYDVAPIPTPGVQVGRTGFDLKVRVEALEAQVAQLIAERGQ
jgi:hypothetical protein